MDNVAPEKEMSGDVSFPVRRRNLKGRKKLCPNCLSELEKFGELGGWLIPQDYYCEKCGYKGNVALEEMPSDLEISSNED